MKYDVELWTDGSCNYQDRIGGWGFVIIIGGHEIEMSGSSVDTTSNRMEMMAVIRGLSVIKTPSKVKVFTDSEYVRNGILKNGWVDKGHMAVKNYDLWGRMNKIVNHHVLVKPVWVKGHSNIHYNERADKLAGNARIKRVNRSK